MPVSRPRSNPLASFGKMSLFYCGGTAQGATAILAFKRLCRSGIGVDKDYIESW